MIDRRARRAVGGRWMKTRRVLGGKKWVSQQILPILSEGQIRPSRGCAIYRRKSRCDDDIIIYNNIRSRTGEVGVRRTDPPKSSGGGKEHRRDES
jgi:hypothetical protein